MELILGKRDGMRGITVDELKERDPADATLILCSQGVQFNTLRNCRNPSAQRICGQDKFTSSGKYPIFQKGAEAALLQLKRRTQKPIQNASIVVLLRFSTAMARLQVGPMTIFKLLYLGHIELGVNVGRNGGNFGAQFLFNAV